MINYFLRMNFKNSVFKVKIIREYVDYTKPWQTSNRSHGTGSSFAIALDFDEVSGAKDKFVIITNAHVVDCAINVSIDVDSISYICDVEYIIPEFDLAIIKPRDNMNIVPLKIGKSPKQLERVIIAGFPFGGDNISTTEGVVSRIDAVEYYGGIVDNIAILVDAVMNPGNSGGPALLNDGKIAGVAFSQMSNAQNMNYIIPNVILKLFIRLYVNKIKWRGISYLPIETRELLNSSLREVLKVSNDKGSKTKMGILVSKLVKLNLGKVVEDLKEEDVIMKINSHDVTGSGKIQWNDQYIDYNMYINILQPGMEISMEIVRGGKVMEIKHRLMSKEMLVPSTDLYAPLSYAVIYGLVFLPLSYPLMDAMNKNSWAYIENLVKSGAFIYDFEEFKLDDYLREEVKKNKQQIIVMTEILPDEKNRGYEPFKRKLKSVNGQKIYNIGHLVNVILGYIGKVDVLKFEFENDFIYINITKENTHEKFINYNKTITKSILGIDEFIKIQ